MGKNSQDVLIFSKEAMRLEAHCTLHGGPACSRRALLWTGVTGGPRPDRMDLSVDQYNFQVRKSSVWISGPCLYNQQRGIVLHIRDVFCIILASSPAHEHVVHEGAAVVCTAVQSGRSFQHGPEASTDLLGPLWSKEGAKSHSLAGLCQSHAAGVGHSRLFRSGQVYYLGHSLRKQVPRTSWVQHLLFSNLINYLL